MCCQLFLIYTNSNIPLGGWKPNLNYYWIIFSEGSLLDKTTTVWRKLNLGKCQLQISRLHLCFFWGAKRGTPGLALPLQLQAAFLEYGARISDYLSVNRIKRTWPRALPSFIFYCFILLALLCFELFLIALHCVVFLQEMFQPKSRILLNSQLPPPPCPTTVTKKKIAKEIQKFSSMVQNNVRKAES